MTIGIALEKDMNRPFAVSLANGLPEEIRRDDVAALREEWAMLIGNYRLTYDVTYIDKANQAWCEIETHLAEARKAGFDTKGW